MYCEAHIALKRVGYLFVRSGGSFPVIEKTPQKEQTN